MGGAQDKPQVIDTNQAARMLTFNSQDFELQIKQAFTQASQNGKIYRDKFNEALSVLETLKIRRIRDSPLGDRLFSVLDSVINNNIKL